MNKEDLEDLKDVHKRTIVMSRAVGGPIKDSVKILEIISRLERYQEGLERISKMGCTIEHQSCPVCEAVSILREEPGNGKEAQM